MLPGAASGPKGARPPIPPIPAKIIRGEPRQGHRDRPHQDRAGQAGGPPLQMAVAGPLNFVLVSAIPAWSLTSRLGGVGSKERCHGLAKALIQGGAGAVERLRSMPSTAAFRGEPPGPRMSAGSFAPHNLGGGGGGSRGMGIRQGLRIASCQRK